MGGEFAALAQRIGQNRQEQVTDQFGWKKGQVEETYKKVKDAGAGECTSFGYFAAHILTTTPKNKPRVELVAWKKESRYLSKKSGKMVKSVVTHVYCIVNRVGAYVMDDKGECMLPEMKDWTGEWYIVDSWAGAMGWGVVFKQGEHFPYRGSATSYGMAYPLYLQMVYDPA